MVVRGLNIELMTETTQEKELEKSVFGCCSKSVFLFKYLLRDYRCYIRLIDSDNLMIYISVPYKLQPEMIQTRKDYTATVIYLLREPQQHSFECTV